MSKLNRYPSMVAEVLLAVIIAILCSCNSTSTHPESPIIDMSSTSSVAPATQLPTPARNDAPSAAEVKAALARVFADDVVIPMGSENKVLEGDFNGDGSVDLAVVVRPTASKLQEVNSQVANWTIQNPHHAFIPPRNKSVVRLPPSPAPESITSDELLLAVIHGTGSQGWRDSGARQAFLLRHAAGTDMQVASPSPKLKHDIGAFAAPANDVVAETLAGISGVLYWTGAGYAWHPELR